jgi:hypothetical protein
MTKGEQQCLSEHTTFVLTRIREFFRGYRPTFQDKAWAKAKLAAVEAELARRGKEDTEGTL